MRPAEVVVLVANNEPGTNQAGSEEHVVIFQLSSEYYALDIQSVQEIVRMQSITAIPGSDPWVLGITNLRGRVVPVFDLRRRCGIEAGEVTPATRIVVVQAADGMVGLTVDSVTEVMRIPADCIEFPHELSALSEHSYIRGIAKLEDRLVSLLDLDGILPSRAETTAEPESVALEAA